MKIDAHLVVSLKTIWRQRKKTYANYFEGLWRNEKNINKNKSRENN